MTRSLLSVWHAEGDAGPTPEQVTQTIADVDAFHAEVEAAGAWVLAGGLHPVDTARVVSHRAAR
jgi:hypothetical protein